jgi:hypothetical protein
MLEMFKKLIGDKKEYKMMMARVEALPEVNISNILFSSFFIKPNKKFPKYRPEHFIL